MTKSEIDARTTCIWSRDGDEDGDTWATGCGKYFTIIDGTPADNDFRFCTYCGKPLEELQPEIEEDGE